MPYLVGIRPKHHPSICRRSCIHWNATLVPRDVAMPSDLHLIIWRCMLVNSEWVCVSHVSTTRSSGTFSLLVFQDLLHFTFWYGRRCPFDLCVDIFNLSHAALAEVARTWAPYLVLLSPFLIEIYYLESCALFSSHKSLIIISIY
jgi:hypothetical protein